MRIIFLCFISLLCFSAKLFAITTNEPRVIIALYHSKSRITENPVDESYVHLYAETPLNHLGLKVEYYDVNKPLPDLSKRDDVRGVITWFNAHNVVDNPTQLFRWANKTLRAGKKFVIMGAIWAEYSNENNLLNSLMFSFYNNIGISIEPSWFYKTYKLVVKYKDPKMIDFERHFDINLPGFVKVKAVKPDVKSFLSYKLSKSSDESVDLVITSPRGGYIAEDYAANLNAEAERAQQWFIDPFLFFSKAFATNKLPKPDTSTLAGRRIFFSHIDGDGWNNITWIHKYVKKQILCSEVILKDVIDKFPDLPVSVGVIGADIDLDWYGSKEARKIAAENYKRPYVEGGTHTYTHPFLWSFFENYTPEKEAPFASKYKGRYLSLANKDNPKRGRLHDWLLGLVKNKNKIIKNDIKNGGHESNKLSENYDVPRAYGKEPFNLKHEILGAFKEIGALMPKGKKVDVLMWSGNCRPFEAAIRMVREAGVEAINGGDTRFDAEYPSYLWVAPIGREVGKEVQVFAVNSNENTYTDLWEGKFYGYKYLVQTLENTEHPMRVRPINIYYHTYSGEKEASLNAVISNLEYADKQEICPVKTSRYCKIARAFYKVQFERVGNYSWRVKSRGALQTIRFDALLGKYNIDYSKSTGVIGTRHYQDSLYIYLDEANPEPVITLTKRDNNKIISLYQSRWRVFNLKRSDKTFEFDAKGFGKGEFEWFFPEGSYECEVYIGDNKCLTKKTEMINGKNMLKFSLDKGAIDGIKVKVNFTLL